jgi:phosphatidate cytidylyltransferase
VTGSDPAQAAARAPRRAWGDLGSRIVSAVVLLAIVIAALWFGGYVYAAVVGAAFAGAYREWEQVVTLQPLSVFGGVLIAAVALSGLVYPWLGGFGTMGIVTVAAVAALVAGREPSLWRAGGLMFLGLVVVAALSVRGATTDGIWASVLIGTCIWGTDTGAFFTGRVIGGEKLAPDISPGKTWSGAIGGLVFATVAGTIVWYFVTDSPLWIGVLLAASASVLGQIGDLAESAVKRRFRVKDSGDLIPGHGGLMDRLDSITFGIIFVFLVGALHGGSAGVAAGYLHW